MFEGLLRDSSSAHQGTGVGFALRGAGDWLKIAASLAPPGFNDARDGVCIHSGGTVLHLCASLPRLIGDRPPEDVIGSAVQSLFHPSDRDRITAALADARGGRPSGATTATLLTSGGGTELVELTALRAEAATPPVDLLYVRAGNGNGEHPGNEDGEEGSEMMASNTSGKLAEPRRSAVLICDDEARLGALTAGLLSEYGFVPVTVGTGEEALAALARPEPHIDVLLLDVNLSEGRSAREVLVAMRDHGTSTRVILTSGLAEEDVEEDLLRHPLVVAYIAKPYAVDHLVQAIRKAVSAPRQ